MSLRTKLSSQERNLKKTCSDEATRYSGRFPTQESTFTNTCVTTALHNRHAFADPGDSTVPHTGQYSNPLILKMSLHFTGGMRVIFQSLEHNNHGRTQINTADRYTAVPYSTQPVSQDVITTDYTAKTDYTTIPPSRKITNENCRQLTNQWRPPSVTADDSFSASQPTTDCIHGSVRCHRRNPSLVSSTADRVFHMKKLPVEHGMMLIEGKLVKLWSHKLRCYYFYKEERNTFHRLDLY